MKFPPTSDIRRIRKSLDVTQTALAAQSGVSQSTIAKIERGRISASYETVVKLFTALDDLAAHGPRRDLTAAEVASRDVVTVQSTDKIRVATELMRTAGFSQLPVLKGDAAVGSISERGIFDRVRNGANMDELKDTPVASVMDESFPVVAESTPVSTVTTMMSDASAVLVARKGKIVGVITKADILKLI